MVIREQPISEMCHWPWDSFSSYLLNKSLTLCCWCEKKKEEEEEEEELPEFIRHLRSSFALHSDGERTKSNFLFVWLNLKRGNYLPLPSVKRGLTVGTQKKTSCDEWRTAALLSVYSGRNVRCYLLSHTLASAARAHTSSPWASSLYWRAAVL